MTTKTTLDNVIVLTVGDWSGDGHNMTASRAIKTNLTPKELEKAFDKGVKKSGMDITCTCEDCEDSHISLDMWNYFHSRGIKGDLADIYEDEDRVIINVDTYFDIYLKTCEIGNPDFKYEITKDKNTINIGGYGLFST